MSVGPSVQTSEMLKVVLSVIYKGFQGSPDVRLPQAQSQNSCKNILRKTGLQVIEGEASIH